MKKCKNCGKKFDPEEASEYFTEETMLTYENLNQCLCGECAVEVIESKIDGLYHETCEECGRTFDLFEEEIGFDNFFDGLNGISLRDTWQTYGIVCAPCANELLKDEFDEFNEDNEDEIGEGCAACGNPAYPDCMSSCPLFDD